MEQYKVDEALVAAVEKDVVEEDPRVQKFTVTNPVKVGSHIKYSVTGVDDEGDF